MTCRRPFFTPSPVATLSRKLAPPCVLVLMEDDANSPTGDARPDDTIHVLFESAVAKINVLPSAQESRKRGVFDQDGNQTYLMALRQGKRAIVLFSNPTRFEAVSRYNQANGTARFKPSFKGLSEEITGSDLVPVDPDAPRLVCQAHATIARPTQRLHSCKIRKCQILEES